MNQEPLENRQSTQQNFGNINLSGDENDFNIVDGNNNIITFNRTKIIQVSVEEIKTREFKEASPYKGLKRFEAVDKDRFFGRDQFLTGLVNELEQSNLLLLLGASGSGKSSIIRAGLIPWLSEKLGSRFTDLTFTPNQDPFSSLYQILHDRYPQTEAEFLLEGKTDSLIQVVNRVKPSEDFCFIFIDQFEELFTISQKDKSAHFIESLVHLVKSLTKTGNNSVKIVATMRADFLDRLSPYSHLIKVTDKHRPMIAEMQSDELRLAIEQPAAHHGVVFERGLVEEIIKDVQGQAGYLPLLQYTLDLLWKTEKETGSIQDRTLNISTYRRLGGVRGALQKHVDLIYNNFSKQEQLTVQRIFLKLVGIGGDEESETQWRPIRRPANRSEFSDELEKKILTRLINQNLLVSNRPDLFQESTIEIAHEILLTSWSTLSSWIVENRQAIALRHRLNDDVERWHLKKAEDELWSGSKLEQVLELRKDQTFNQVLGGFSLSAKEFINASEGKRDRLLREEQERAQREIEQLERLLKEEEKAAKAERMRTRFAVATAGFASFAMLTLGVSFWQQQQNEKISEAFFLDANTVDSSTRDTFYALPIVYERANKIWKSADQLANNADIETAITYYSKNKQEINRSLAYYRSILRASQRLQKAVTQEPTNFPSNAQKSLQNYSKQAANSLAKIIHKYRIPELKYYLTKKEFGNRKLKSDDKEFENRYTEGALRTTYLILERESGAGADLNNNGLIDTPEEADQIPCETIVEIEKLWREATNGHCGWLGEKSPYQDADCELGRKDNKRLIPVNNTLTKLVIGSPNEAVNRIEKSLKNACKSS
jgi:energy-coupling factor transporter ATP-binding protein EcfA2